MKCPLLLIVVLPCALAGTVRAQNLVPNPGFEESDSCFLGIGIFPPGTGPTHWYSANLTYDHLQSCLPYGTVNSLPMNLLTYQQPFEGNSCAGVLTYHKNGPLEDREWIMAPLLSPLIVGQTYYCSFHANAAMGGYAEYPQIWLANNKVGMLFTTYDRHWYWGDPYPLPLNYAHVFHPQIIGDTAGWTLVSGSFVADSAYQYLMIGNFFSNAQTDTLHLAPETTPPNWYPRGYTLVDQVCVSVSPDGCDIGQALAESSDAAVSIFPNPTRDELLVTGATGCVAGVHDPLGREVWRGRITSDRWVLATGGWQRGAYVLRLEQKGTLNVFKFVLID